MASLGSLVVSLEANIARFETDLAQAEKVAKVATDRITGFASDAMKALKGMAAGFVAAYTFDAILSKAKDTIAMAASFKELAEKTGASVEQLSGLAKAAKLSNTDLGTMEGGLIRLSKSLAGVDDESKGAAHALDVLGLAQKDLQTLSPVEAMKAIADKLAEYRDGAGKTALAMDVFGKSGAQLLPMLKELAEQESLNGKITTEQAELAYKYEQSMRSLSAASGDFAKTIAMTVLPTLSSMAQQMNDGIKIAGGFWSALLAGATINPFKSVGENIKSISADMAQMKKDATDYQYFDEKAYERKRVQLEMLKSQQRQAALESTQGLVGRLDARDLGPKPTLDGYQSRMPTAPKVNTPKGRSVKIKLPEEDNDAAFNSYIESLERMIKRQDESEYSAMQMNLSQLALKANISETSDRFKDASAKIVQYRDSIESNKLRDYSDALHKTSEEYQFQTGIMNKTAYQQEQLTIVRRNGLAVEEMIAQAEKAHRPLSVAAQEQLRKASLDATDSMLRDLDARRAADEEWSVGAVRAYDKYMNSARNVAGMTEDLFTNAYQGIQGAMADFLFNPFEKGVQGMLKSFGVMLQRMIADAVAADLSKRLFGAVGTPTSGGWMSSLLGMGSPTMAGAGSATENWIDSGGLAKSAGGLLSGIGGFFSNLFSFDVGTDYVPRDMIAQIHQGERIIPASQNTGANGQTIQVTQHFHGPTSAQDVRRAGGDLARNLLGAMSEARRYG